MLSNLICYQSVNWFVNDTAFFNTRYTTWHNSICQWQCWKPTNLLKT